MALSLGVLSSARSGNLATGAFESIATVTASAATTSTFSSIPSTYKALQVRFNLVTSTNSYWQVRFNGDTGSNYAYHILAGSSTVVVNVAATQTARLVSSEHTAAAYPNVVIIDVADYASASKNKTMRTVSGSNQNTAGGVNAGNVELASGLWLSTAAINSLTIFVGSGTYTGTIALYGVN